MITVTTKQGTRKVVLEGSDEAFKSLAEVLNNNIDWEETEQANPELGEDFFVNLGLEMSDCLIQKS